MSPETLKRKIKYETKYGERGYGRPPNISRDQIEIVKVEESNGNWHNVVIIHPPKEESELEKNLKKNNL